MTLPLDTPRWAPLLGTVAVVEAGVHWDAVAVQQDLGLAALSVLDQETGHQSGPVIWDTRGRGRLYFLVPVGTTGPATDPALGARPLSRGTYVGVPSVDQIDPAGLCWIAPPAPADPDRLVDPHRLTAALRHVTTARWVTRAVAGGREVEILASDEQLAGRACIVCRATRTPLHPDGVVTVPGTGVVHDYEVVVCTSHLRLDP